MAWKITCSETECRRRTTARNIVDLIRRHTDESGNFLCTCGAHGYIRKRFKLQEPGKIWEPHLHGVITLGKEGNVYQPFVFLVNYESNPDITDIWFSYYKDMRKFGGKLKLGYGPGGPPVLRKTTLIQLIATLVNYDHLKLSHVISALK